MRIADLVSREAIVIGRDRRDRMTWIRRLTEAAARGKGIDVEQACRDIADRERTGATLLPVGEHGVAIPHARTAACKQLVLAVGIPARPVPWSGGSADIVFLLLAPRETHALYLRALSRIARLCESEGVLDLLTAAPSAETVVAVLAAAEGPLGDLGPVEELPRVCVVGAGAGGLATAGHLSLLGCSVSLYNRSRQRIAAVRSAGGVQVHGALEGFARVAEATDSAAAAVEGADVIMVVVPATAHGDVARILAPHLRDGQIVVLNPGGFCGALEVAHALTQHRSAVRPYLAEARSLPYSCRITEPGVVRVFGIRDAVPLSVLPASQGADVLPAITKVLPHFTPGDDVLRAGLEHLAAVFHPAIAILNASRIEDARAGFDSLAAGVTPAVAAVLETIDRERLAVAAALGMRLPAARELLSPDASRAGRTLQEVLAASREYAETAAPQTVRHRSLTEDVPASLVPIASLGGMIAVPTPCIQAVIGLASAAHGVDYFASGRTVEKLGIAGWSARDLRRMVVGPDLPADPPRERS